MTWKVNKNGNESVHSLYEHSKDLWQGWQEGLYKSVKEHKKNSSALEEWVARIIELNQQYKFEILQAYAEWAFINNELQRLYDDNISVAIKA